MRSAPLRACAPALLGLLAACDPALPARCTDYGDEALEGYCLTREAAAATTPADVARICADAGSWRATCHEVWLLEALKGGGGRFPRADLLALALTDDARLLVLDGAPEADPVAQMAVCERSAGRYACDCVFHGLVRWAETRPSASEIARVALAPTQCAEQHASGIGMAIGCAGVGTCDGVRRTASCLAEATRSAGPGACGRPRVGVAP